MARTEEKKTRPDPSCSRCEYIGPDVESWSISGESFAHLCTPCREQADRALSAHVRKFLPKKPEVLQRGSDHYKQGGIEPIEFIVANDLPFCEGNVVKYVTRWKLKGGRADLDKARHYIDLLIALGGVDKETDA